MNDIKISIIIPAFNEGALLTQTLSRIEAVGLNSFECLIIVDSIDDSTNAYLEPHLQEFKFAKLLIQSYGKGPANAIRYGMDQAQGECVVVTMADGSDDPKTILDLSNLIFRGVSIACASRYMSGGQQVGGPRFKKFLSKTAGRILYHLARIDTHDPTNSFKAYSIDFLQLIDIESRNGFEIGLELTAKAKRLRRPIAEVPTIWLDRTSGESNFKLAKWLPVYFRWFIYAFGPRLKHPSKPN